MTNELLKNLPQISDLDGLIPIEKAAELLGISKHTIYLQTKSAATHPIPFYRVGRRTYFEKKVLADWIRNYPNAKK